jgi:hypothetical protein
MTKLRVRSAYRASFKAPSRGRLTVTLRAHTVRIATADRRFAKHGPAPVALPLRARGKRLLERTDRVTLDAKVVFVPVGEEAVTRTKRVTLSAP